MPRRRSRANPLGAAMRSAATAVKAQEAMNAAAAVIAARTEMAAAACAAPSLETNLEMSLMVSEKVEAFSQSGVALGRGVDELARRSTRYALTEAAAGASHLARLASCRTPMDLALAQSRMMSDFFSRSLAYSAGLNGVAARTGEQALQPIHRTVTANQKRLKRR